MPEYIRTPYAQDPRTMLDLMRLASADRSRADQNRAAVRSQGVLNIGQLIAGTLASIGQERQQRAVMQAQAERQQQDDAFKRRDQQLREADTLSRIDQQRQTAERQAQMDQRQSQMDAEKRGTAAVNDMGGYGPLAESQVDDVMQSPAAGRTRYSFGPGQANGPEVQPSAPQLQQIEMRKKLEGMGYSFGPNGQVIPPQKPEAPPRPVSVPDGGRLVDPTTGKVVYTAPPVRTQPTQRNPIAVMGPDGNPVFVDPSEAVGKRPPSTREQPTEDERKTAGFYQRMTDALKTMDAVEDQLTPRDIYQIQSLPQEDLVGALNRGQMSDAAKRYIRAMTQFTEARLRADSGAAISSGEYASDRQVYAKQYGETPELSADRRRARSVAVEGIKTRAGRSLPKDTGNGMVTLIAPNGQEQEVPADQVEHYKSLGAKVKGQ